MPFIQLAIRQWAASNQNIFWASKLRLHRISITTGHLTGGGAPAGDQMDGGSSRERRLLLVGACQIPDDNTAREGSKQ